MVLIGVGGSTEGNSIFIRHLEKRRSNGAFLFPVMLVDRKVQSMKDYNLGGVSMVWKGDKTMRVLMLSWEYPPYSVGGLARHVEDLAETMAEQNCFVHVITTGSADLLARENRNGVWVDRV